MQRSGRRGSGDRFFLLFYALILSGMLSFFHSVSMKVTKHAVGPIKSLIGSERNTPFTPSPSRGSSSAIGATISALRRSEKNVACLLRPSATKPRWPAICRLIIINSAKYVRQQGMPAAISVSSSVNTRSSAPGNSSVMPQISVAAPTHTSSENRNALRTRLYSPAP